MQIILSENCASFTGAISKKYGYAVRKQKGGFYGCRNSNGRVPPDGHLNFIFTHAEIAHQGLLLADVLVHVEELIDALQEARKWVPAGWLEANKNNVPRIYHARDILNFKTTFSL